MARNLNWTLRLRIEDLDTERVAAACASASTGAGAGADADAMADLAWLGIDHDGPVVRQSERLPHYERAMRTLADAGLVYASPHTRRDVREAAQAADAAADAATDGSATSDASTSSETAEAAAALSAPHAGDRSRAFPRSLRPARGPAWCFTDPRVNHRFAIDAGPGTRASSDAALGATGPSVLIHDELNGARTFHPAETDGDFLVWTKSGYPAYQLAVVVDDALQGVTDVVRGDDLLPSAALQTLVYRALGAPPPRWWHVPLVLDSSGQRMAKRKGSASLSALRRAGANPERVVGLAAWWIGLQASLAPMQLSQFRRDLCPSMLREWCRRARLQPPTLDETTTDWLARS